MDMSKGDHVERVVDSLSALIRMESASVACEQHHPGGSPDDSDDRIKTGLRKVEQLRRMRSDFEDLAAGVVKGLPGTTKTGELVFSPGTSGGFDVVVASSNTKVGQVSGLYFLPIMTYCLNAKDLRLIATFIERPMAEKGD